MKLGFSLSPGGLLLPYHVGVLTSLSNRGYITPSTPLAGSSAGAIAVAAHGVGIPPETMIEGTIRINQKCDEFGKVSGGKLLSFLHEELEMTLPPNAHEILNQREGIVGLAYKEIFPQDKNILQTNFDSKDDFIEAICNSSMFPFFSTPWPCVIRGSKKKQNQNLQSSSKNTRDNSTPENSNKINFALPSLPRLIVDGYFTVPRDRFGCPIFPDESSVERTITISVFPHDTIGLTASNQRDRISPKISSVDSAGQLSMLFQRATQVSNDQACWEMYEEGVADAQRWMGLEEANVPLI